MRTFRFNSKCALLKLLCTLARLCEGIPLQPLRLDFLSRPRSQSHNCHFSDVRNRTRGKARKSHERAPYPNLTTPPPFAPIRCCYYSSSYAGPNAPVIRRFLDRSVVPFFFVVVMVVVSVSGRRRWPSTLRPHGVEMTDRVTANEGAVKYRHAA